jgi:hypothetical protein
VLVSFSTHTVFYNAHRWNTFSGTLIRGNWYHQMYSLQKLSASYNKSWYK